MYAIVVNMNKFTNPLRALELAQRRVKQLESEMQSLVADTLISTGLSCRELASNMGYSAGYVSDLQNCRRHISQEVINKIVELGY